MTDPSDRYRLVEQTLGESVDGFVRERRERERPISYRLIAIELTGRTGIDVTHEWVRRIDKARRAPV